MSNIFYFTFNPIFKDFPFRTAQHSLLIKILMLCSRGMLMSVILVPASYYLKRDHEARTQRRENERLALEKIKIENRLLEQAVIERTRALQQTLNTLEQSQENLEYQLYIQSRLVASITHDIRAPFQFLIIISDKIKRLSAEKNVDAIGEYSQELHQSLEQMYGYVENLLEYTRLPVQQKLDKSDEINLAALIEEKLVLFEGALKTNQNTLATSLDPTLAIKSNANLLGIVLHNLIDNANKHTHRGTIHVACGLTENGPEITIQNSGTPASPALSDWMNTENAPSAANISTEAAGQIGIGLILVREITSILDIRIAMEVANGTTKICLRF